jgi:thymidylate synthase (FAD)
MTAHLISWSQTSDGKSILEQVAYAARVSNPENQNSNHTAERLVTYLARNHHWSPFEMVNICLEIETTRDIARQILRHRSFSFQEFSQRYAIVNSEFDERRARMQDNRNRQNSIETNDTELQRQWNHMQSDVAVVARRAYEWALDNGVAKEQARAVLPEGMTRSRLYMNGTLRSWIHYIALRSENGTQKEHRDVARACAEAIRPIFALIDSTNSIGNN